MLHFTPTYTLRGIPGEAHGYVVDGRKPHEWALEPMHPYRIRREACSNGPNAWYARQNPWLKSPAHFLSNPDECELGDGVVDVFVLERNDGYTVTDFGDALGWLDLQSASQKRSPKQDALIRDVCLTLRIELSRGQLVVRRVASDGLGESDAACRP